VVTTGDLVHQDEAWTIIRMHHDPETAESENNDYMKIPTPIVIELRDLTATDHKIEIQR